MAGMAFKSALYNCATNCAIRRQDRKCKAQFGSSTCISCRLYIGNYANADPRHMELFMMEAEGRAYELRHASDGPKIAIAVGLIAIASLFVIPMVLVPKKASTTQPATKLVEKDEIANTLQKVEYDIKVRRVDVNNDGLVNCIDAAVLFYKYFPDKDRVCIERNVNPATKMNHLFNCVNIDGVWKAIEPQAKWLGYKSYWMFDVWKDAYDKNFNRDETETWKVFVK